MLLLKVALVALACAAQESKPHTNAPFQRKAPDLGELVHKIQSMFSKVKERTEELQNQVENIFRNAYDRLHDMIQDWSDRSYERINTAMAAAESYGFDVSECVNNDDTSIPIVVEKLREETHSCISSQYPEVDKVREKLNKAVGMEREIVQRAKEVVKKCHGKPMMKRIGCEVAVLSPVAAEVGKLMNATGTTASELASTVVKTGSEMRGCIVQSFTSNTEKAREVIRETIACIRRIVPEVTSVGAELGLDASLLDMTVPMDMETTRKSSKMASS